MIWKYSAGLGRRFGSAVPRYGLRSRASRGTIHS